MTENKSEMFDGVVSCYCGSNGGRNGDRCGRRTTLNCPCECHLEPPLVELRDRGGLPDELEIKLHTIGANLAKLHEDLAEACALLRRAADVVVAYELHTGSETQVLAAIADYLGRVDPP